MQKVLVVNKKVVSLECGKRILHTKTNKMTYQGWTNYATWRIALENFEGVTSEESGLETAEACRAYVEDFLELQCDNEITLSYALAFTSDVNWYEILTHINSERRQ